MKMSYNNNQFDQEFDHANELRRAMNIIADTLNVCDKSRSIKTKGMLCTENMRIKGLHKNVVRFMGVLVRACLENRVSLGDMANLCEALFANALLGKASLYKNDTLQYKVCKRYANLTTQHSIRHGSQVVVGKKPRNPRHGHKKNGKYGSFSNATSEEDEGVSSTTSKYAWENDDNEPMFAEDDEVLMAPRNLTIAIENPVDDESLAVAANLAPQDDEPQMQAPTDLQWNVDELQMQAPTDLQWNVDEDLFTDHLQIIIPSVVHEALSAQAPAAAPIMELADIQWNAGEDDLFATTWPVFASTWAFERE